MALAFVEEEVSPVEEKSKGSDQCGTRVAPRGLRWSWATSRDLELGIGTEKWDISCQVVT